jgi:hypothetical protein
MNLTLVRAHLEAAQRWGHVREWCSCGPYVEITWKNRSRSLVERGRVIARLRADREGR